MKKRIPVLLAVLLAACLAAGCAKVVVQVPADVLNIFGSPAAAPAADAAPATTAPVAETPSQVDTTAAPVADTTAAPTADATTAPNNGGQTPATTAAPATTAPAKPASGAPSSKEEIIQYYVNAYNKIATDAKSVTRTYDYTKNYNGIVEVGGNERLAGLAQTLMNQFMKENFEQIAGDASSLPPIGVSKLSISPSQISSATCTDKGSTYEIVLKSTGTDANREVDVQPGQGSVGVIGPLLRTEDVSGAAGALIKFEGLHAYYATGSVTATVDKASGHITAVKYDVPCVLHFDKATAFVIVTVNNTEIGLEFLQEWTISY